MLCAKKVQVCIHMRCMFSFLPISFSLISKCVHIALWFLFTGDSFFSATGKLYISNALNGSKLFIDYDHSQVTSFKAKYVNVTRYYYIIYLSLLALYNNFIFFRLGDIASSNVLSQHLSQSSSSQGEFEYKSFSYTNYVKSIVDINTLQNVISIIYYCFVLPFIFLQLHM